ncbi:MAG TPA: hypothetical protein VGH51_18680 [Candidatus Angelobacter sp.]|jgi:hypothetical protein
MNGNADSRNIQEAVPLAMLRRYLLAHGWTLAASAPKPQVELQGVKPAAAAFFRQRAVGQRSVDVYLFANDFELVLPRDRMASDSSRRVESAIETLSRFEGRPSEQVVADVRSIGFDVVRSSIPDEFVYEDTIHLIRATNYIEGVKNLLASTATTELNPTPYFLRLRKEANTFAEQCRFGHTFRGSFGFTIESPIIPNLAPTLPGVEQLPPFERRVMQRLARGIRTVCDAVQAKDTSPVVNSVKVGFSANACEQFADLLEKTASSGMEFGFSLSPEWPSPEEFKTASSFRVGPAHVEFSRAAAKLMRESPISRPERIFGRIIRLQNEADPTDLLDQTSDREVVVQWSSEELGDIQVRVALSPTDYLSAVESHRNGRPVRISGTLERQGRRWVLSAPAGFGAVD